MTSRLRLKRMYDRHRAEMSDGYEVTRWWRVMRDGKLWAETSSESDALSRIEPGDVLERLYQRTDYEWREVPAVGRPWEP